MVNYLTCHDQGKVTANYYHANREAIRAAVLTLPTIPTFTGDEPLALVNAAGNAPQGKTIDEPSGDVDATEARFRAFCAAWDALASDAERERAQHYISNR